VWFGLYSTSPEGVKHRDHASKSNGANGLIGVAVTLVHDLQNAGLVESPLAALRGYLSAKLSLPQCDADAAVNILGKAGQVFPTAADAAHTL
jgi:hypothetical protein